MSKTQIPSKPEVVTLPPSSQNGPAPRVSPDGSYQLTARRPGRELFPSSWLRMPTRIVYDSGGKGIDLDGTLIELRNLLLKNSLVSP